jgi:hypothetical protein
MLQYRDGRLDRIVNQKTFWRSIIDAEDVSLLRALVEMNYIENFRIFKHILKYGTRDQVKWMLQSINIAINVDILTYIITFSNPNVRVEYADIFFSSGRAFKTQDLVKSAEIIINAPKLPTNRSYFNNSGQKILQLSLTPQYVICFRKSILFFKLTLPVTNCSLY